MLQIAELPERRTATDMVFDSLRDAIVALKLLPGAKLSEAEVARGFGVSRQPVRDAFNRLANLDLLLIRPQKATEVRGFSMERIAYARFVRLAVELEVIRRACAAWDDWSAEILAQNLDRQERAIESGEADSFHRLDREFHELICELGGRPLAIQTIRECKQKVDRICVLSLGRAREATTLLDDHHRIADALAKSSEDAAASIARLHLSRLDATIEEIQRTHSEFFE